MEKNIERAIAGARAEAIQKAALYREMKSRSREELSPIKKFLRRKMIENYSQELTGIQKAEEDRGFALGTITDLSFFDNNAWILHAEDQGVSIDIQKKDRNGKKLYSVKVGGESPPDHEFSKLARLYSSAVDEIQGILKEQETRGESSRRPQEEFRRDLERAKSEDQLGHFKVLGLKPNDFEGLNENQIAAMINAKYRLAARKKHPDMQSGDSASMKKLNTARDALLSAYMTKNKL